MSVIIGLVLVRMDKDVWTKTNDAFVDFGERGWLANRD